VSGLKRIRIAVLASLAMSWAGQVSSYDSEGTDYWNLVTQRWTEDSANELLELVNVFACLIANSRGDLPEHVNGSWSALIDEVACDIADGQTRGGKQYAEVLLSSSRASDDSDQEMQAYLESVSGDRYIANMTLRQSLESLPPYGSWYFSFYNNRRGVSGPEKVLDLDGDNGFADIRQNGNDIEIAISENYIEGSVFSRQAGRVILVDGSEDVAKFVGTKEYNHGGGSGSLRLAGQANADYYFKADLGADGSVLSSQCLARRDLWQNNWRTRLYYAEDGAAYDAGDEVILDGAFSFQAANGVNGYFGHWGVWMQGGASFSPEAPSLSATRRRDNAPVEINWGPGYLESLVDESKVLSDGDIFRWWGEIAGAWSEYVIQWSSTDAKFIYNGAPIDLTDPWDRFMYSPALNGWGTWDGLTGFNYQKRAKLDGTSLFAANSTTEFTCADDRGCPTVKVTHGNWTANSSTASSPVDKTVANSYFYTGGNPPSGFMAYTLYYNTNGNGSLDAGDTPIFFGFKTSWSDQQSTYSEYGAGGTEGNFDGNWPQLSVRLALAGTTTEYEYQTGAYEWDHGYYATDANGEGLSVEQPVQFTYTFDPDNDVNDGKSLEVDLKIGDYNPLGGPWPKPFSPDDMDGNVFFLNYDGESVFGFPGINIDAGGSESMWLQLGNLANGTELTGSDGIKYVVKTAEAGLFFLSAASSNCDEIAFTNVSQIGLSLSDVPDLADGNTYPRPSQSWSNRPTPDSTACEVVHGKATCP
jgi:hypothetical protein